MKEKAQLEKTIETLRENSERQVRVFPTQTPLHGNLLELSRFLTSCHELPFMYSFASAISL